ncbi:MAG: uroporphyrinogen-III synthase [Rhodothermales bacterium]
MPKPLAGMRIVVTRPREQADGLFRRLDAEGATPIPFPTIRIAPMADTTPLDDAVSHLERYDWIIFTSVNGVVYFWERLGGANRSSIPKQVRVAAIGPATAGALRERGCAPEFLPDEFVAERMLEGLGEVAGKKFLLPRAQIARKSLPDLLVSAGALVDDIATYRTLAETPGDDEMEAIEEGVDVLTFTSSSTVRNFAKIFGERAGVVASEALIACIGPMTAKTAQDLGFEVGLVAREYTSEGLVDALTRHLQVTE